MDIDILKPSTGYLTVERPLASSSGTSLDQGRSGDTTPPQTYDEPVSEGEEDEAMDLEPAKDEEIRTGLPHVDVAAAIAYREISLKEREYGGSNSPGPSLRGEDEVSEHTRLLDQHEEEHVSVQPRPLQKPLSIDPLALSTTFDKRLKERLNGDRNGDDQATPLSPEAQGLNEEEIPEQERLLVRDWVAPSGKKIAVPVRIEPKVYFANERTFLASLFLVLLLSTLRSVLTRWGPTDVAKLCRPDKFYRDDAHQLYSPRRSQRAYQRRALYAGGAPLHRVLGHHLRVPCITPSSGLRGRTLLRQVWSSHLVFRVARCVSRQCRVARHRDGKTVMLCLQHERTFKLDRIFYTSSSRLDSQDLVPVYFLIAIIQK